MREQIENTIAGSVLEVCNECGNNVQTHSPAEITEKILSLFREEIEKLKPLSDEEIKDIVLRHYDKGDFKDGILTVKIEDDLEVVQTQLTKTKEDLRKVME